MTIQEFSREFDNQYNNIASNAAPGLSEYEKSLFLTKAQEEILKTHFNAKGNKYREGVGDSIKRQLEFSSLVKEIQVPYVSFTAPKGIDLRSKYFKINETKIMFILNETLGVNDGGIKYYQVIPINSLEYTRLMQRPYKSPLKNQVWRIGLYPTSKETIVEILKPTISWKPTDDIFYAIKYIKRPSPIILEDLSNYGTDISIEGISTTSECEVPEILHKEILDKAVLLAKSSYIGDLNSMASMAQTNE